MRTSKETTTPKSEKAVRFPISTKFRKFWTQLLLKVILLDKSRRYAYVVFHIQPNFGIYIQTPKKNVFIKLSLINYYLDTLGYVYKDKF